MCVRVCVCMCVCACVCACVCVCAVKMVVVDVVDDGDDDDGKGRYQVLEPSQLTCPMGLVPEDRTRPHHSVPRGVLSLHSLSV